MGRRTARRNQSSLIKSKERVKDLGEVFTPPELVNEMLNKLPPDCWEPEKTFLEPACGTGNFLVEILKRKLDAGHTPLQALSTIFAIDIMDDNVKESRKRLYSIVESRLTECQKLIAKLQLERNIICANALELDFSGNWPPKKKEVIKKVRRSKIT
jgi:ubiquinone/menaquinone biosynthesis C-methylase UbiE